MPHTLRPVGAVAALWRYPVKSMQGEALAAAPLGPAGVLGDRAYAVVEADTGRVASAKHPRKWGALFACRAVFVTPPRSGAPPPPVSITLPDGGVVRSDAPGADRALSRALGRAVRLVAAAAGDGHPSDTRRLHAGGPLTRETDRTPLEAPDGAAALIRDEPLALAAPAGTFFDVAPVHLLTTETLAALAARAPGSRFDVRRFRPNIVVRPDGPHPAPTFPENAWVGHALVVHASAGGGPVRLAVIDPTPRCAVVALAVPGEVSGAGPGDLPRDPAVLRTVALANTAESHTLAPGVRFPGVAGVYAAVAESGELRCGDRLVLHPAST